MSMAFSYIWKQYFFKNPSSSDVSKTYINVIMKLEFPNSQKPVPSQIKKSCI